MSKTISKAQLISKLQSEPKNDMEANVYLNFINLYEYYNSYDKALEVTKKHKTQYNNILISILETKECKNHSQYKHNKSLVDAYDKLLFSLGEK